MNEQRQIPRAMVLGTIAILVTMIVGTCMLFVFVFNLPVIFPPPGRTPQMLNLPTLQSALPLLTETALTETLTPLPSTTPELTTPTLPPPTLTMPPTLPPPTTPIATPSVLASATIANTATPTSAPTSTPTPLPGRIVFVTDRDGLSSIYAMRTNGSGQVPLVPRQANARDYAPSISPNGRLLAFSSNRERQDTDDIYVMRMDGTDITRITSARRSKNTSASWFPDNYHLAFTSNRDGKWQVYTVEADGDNVRQVTKRNEDARTVQVAPDGSRLAYTCGNEICLIDRDGSNRSVVVHSEQRKDQLAWSPDMTMIAYAQVMPGSAATSLHIVDRSGRSRTVASEGAWPTWSPDGTRLVFASSVGGTQDLYSYNLRSGEIQRLTNAPSEDYSPVWVR